MGLPSRTYDSVPPQRTGALRTLDGNKTDATSTHDNLTSVLARSAVLAKPGRNTSGNGAALQSWPGQGVETAPVGVKH